MSPTNRGLTLVLASTSAYRRALLARLRLPFETASPQVDETPLRDEAPVATAERLALDKAQSLHARFPRALVIGSDQVAFCEEQRLDKPGHRAGALAQLRYASGKSVSFITAVALFNAGTGRIQRQAVATEVRFRKLSDAEIQRYIDAEPAFDCAGSAKAEGLGIALIESIQSPDPTALIGLPLIALAGMLRNEGLVLP